MEPDSRGSTSEQHLLERARRGSHSAVDTLFRRYRFWLRRWSHGRLPRRARGAVDTSDLVQETLQRTFTHLTSFKSTQARALRVYLRRAVENRIRDEMRRATFRQGVILPEGSVRSSDASNPQLRQLIDGEANSAATSGGSATEAERLVRTRRATSRAQGTRSRAPQRASPTGSFPAAWGSGRNPRT